MKTLTIIAMMLLLAGCANTPVSNADAHLISSADVLDASYLNPAQGAATITIKRDVGFVGSACTTRVFVSAHPVADLQPAEKVVIYLKDGKHILSAIPKGMCGGGIAEIETSVKPGDELSFRIGYGGGGDFYIKPTAF